MFKVLKKTFSTICSSNFVHDHFKHTNYSFCRGSTGIQLLEETIGQRLEITAKKFPNTEALVVSHQEKRFTYEELDHRTTQIAKSLLALNLPQGAKVGIYAPNCYEWVLTQFACARAGFVLVNINPAYQVNDLKYALKKTGVSTLFMPRCLKTSSYVDIVKKICEDVTYNQDPLHLRLRELPDLRQIVLLDDTVVGEMMNKEGKRLNLELDQIKKIAHDNNFISWEDFQQQNFINNDQKKHIDEIFPSIKNSVYYLDPTNIQFTSGTTGLPKGAILTHYNILNNAYLVCKNLEYSEKDRVLVQVPLYHCFGTVLGNLGCIAHGSTIVFPNGIFDPIKSIETIEKEKISSLYGVPTMFLEILNNQQKLNKNLSSLKKGIMAGSVCPKYLMDRCINELGMTDLTIVYGMTELSPATHQVTIHDSFEKKTTTVGALLPHCISKIVDEEGNIVKRNVNGEICSKSFGLMLGYLNDEKATNDAIDEDGFMKTGDLGFIDDDGYLHIIGRKKDTIIRGGENISSKELEDYIGTHPMIDDVQVIAVKDPRLGDEICAWVKVKEQYKGKINKDGIISYCKNQIAHYKIPRYIRFVDSFPMTITGKPQKFIMREISNKIIEEKNEEL